MLTYRTERKPVPINRKLIRTKWRSLALARDYSICWNAIKSEWALNTNLQDGNVAVSIKFGWARMDIDSCIKSILDTLEGIAYHNDKQIVSLSVVRCKSKEITVTVQKKE